MYRYIYYWELVTKLAPRHTPTPTPTPTPTARRRKWYALLYLVLYLLLCRAVSPTSACERKWDSLHYTTLALALPLPLPPPTGGRGTHCFIYCSIYYYIDYEELVKGKDLFYGVMQHYRSHRPQVLMYSLLYLLLYLLLRRHEALPLPQPAGTCYCTYYCIYCYICH
jgi:hypothetical protein